MSCPVIVLAQSGVEADFRGYVKELGAFSLSNDLGTMRYDNILHHRIESRFDLGEKFEIRQMPEHAYSTAGRSITYPVTVIFYPMIPDTLI